MAANSTVPALTLPNPYTPLAWLPPAAASQLQAVQYVSVATLGMFIWDWLLSLPVELTMFFRTRWTLSTAFYLVSRLGSMTYLTTIAIFQVAPVKNCNALLHTTAAAYIFAIPPTTFLFCLRVWAVFPGNRLVLGIFGFLWLAVVGTALLIPLKVAAAEHIGTTQFCIETELSALAGAAVVSNMVLNMLVFAVVSWRLVMINQSDRFDFWALVKGKATSPIASLIIKSGQLYYLVTLSFNIAVFVAFITPSVSPVMRALLTIPHLALENSMATRVFRMLKFDAKSSALNMAPTNPSRRATNHASRSQEESQRSHNMIVFRNRADPGVEVEVSTHIHAENDGFEKAELSV